jgi:hypothetical protein
MPDSRRHRGRHPADEALFAEELWPALRRAVSELSWLSSRGYSEPSALKLVGDRHQLTARQRKAVSRGACGDQQRRRRLDKRVELELLAGAPLAIDGFNLLISVESALSGGLLLRCRDGVWRDLASIHGTYRTVQETDPALALVGALCERLGVVSVRWLLDRPVSNSGRLRGRMEQLAQSRGWPWTVELHDDPDRPLAVEDEAIVVSADGLILDGCRRWVDLVSPLLAEVAEPWCLDLDVEAESSQ